MHPFRLAALAADVGEDFPYLPCLSVMFTFQINNVIIIYINTGGKYG